MDEIDLMQITPESGSVTLMMHLLLCAAVAALNPFREVCSKTERR
jgi:hypothetical protein